ncbi:MAG: phage head-tail connector protein [Christensenellales bacterium]|jgi:hypothetical protein
MLDKLRRRLPDADADDQLLDDLIDDAGRFIRAYTRRNDVPAALEGAQLQLAAVLFNRMGMEGETAHDEGGIRRDAQLLPEDIACQLRPWRLARAVRP